MLSLTDNKKDTNEEATSPCINNQVSLSTPRKEKFLIPLFTQYNLAQYNQEKSHNANTPKDYQLIKKLIGEEYAKLTSTEDAPIVNQLNPLSFTQTMARDSREKDHQEEPRSSSSPGKSAHSIN